MKVEINNTQDYVDTVDFLIQKGLDNVDLAKDYLKKLEEATDDEQHKKDVEKLYIQAEERKAQIQTVGQRLKTSIINFGHLCMDKSVLQNNAK